MRRMFLRTTAAFYLKWERTPHTKTRAAVLFERMRRLNAASVNMTTQTNTRQSTRTNDELMLRSFVIHRHVGPAAVHARIVAHTRVQTQTKVRTTTTNQQWLRSQTQNHEVCVVSVQRRQRMHAINRVAGTPSAGESEYTSRPTHTPQLAFFTMVTTFSNNANFVAQHAAKMQCEPISPKRMEQQIYATIYSGYTHVHFLPTLKEKASSYDPCQKIQPVDLRPAPRSQGRGQRQEPTARMGKNTA